MSSARVFNIEEFFNIISIEVHRDQLSILMRIVEDDFKFDSEAYVLLFILLKQKILTDGQLMFTSKKMMFTSKKNYRA